MDDQAKPQHPKGQLLEKGPCSVPAHRSRQCHASVGPQRAMEKTGESLEVPER